MFSCFETVKLATHKGKGYQVVINSNQLEVIHNIQQRTGLTLSQIVYLCYKIRQNNFRKRGLPIDNPLLRNLLTQKL